MKKLVVLFLALFLVAPAAAHTALVSANPEPGAVLTEAPSEIRLKFNENLLLLDEKNPNKVELFDSSGELISGATTVAGPEVFTTPNRKLGLGDYRVKYRVVSGDGHPIEGEYQFKVDTGVVSANPVTEPEDGPNLLIRLIWVLLAIAAISLAALIRFGKKAL